MTHEETQNKESQGKATQRKSSTKETRRGLGAENTHVRDASAIDDETGEATVVVFSSGTFTKASEADDDGNTHIVLSDRLAVGEKVILNSANTDIEEEG